MDELKIAVEDGTAYLDEETRKPMVRSNREYAVFRAEDGTLIVFPGIYRDDDEGRSINWHQCLTLCMLLGIEREHENKVIEPNAEGKFMMKRIETSIGHSNFRHGSEEVWVIGGPVFEEKFNDY